MGYVIVLKPVMGSIYNDLRREVLRSVVFVGMFVCVFVR